MSHFFDDATANDKIMHVFAPLYGLSSTKKVKKWFIYVEIYNGFPHVTTEYGYVDGEVQKTRVAVKSGKNIGRSNQTTPLEQAIADAQSKWNKKQLENYRQSVPTADTIQLLPMLAQDFKNKSHIVKWPWYGQPKLNGVRCLAVIQNGEVEFWSRKGKQYQTLSHIEQDLLKVFGKSTDIILDGEIFHPDLGFQQIVRRVKRVKTDRQNIEDVKLQFWIYDIVDVNERYKIRLSQLQDIKTQVSDQESLVIVDTQLLSNTEEAKWFDERNRNDGFEGSILRNPFGNYRCDYRSPDLLKYKLFSFKEEDYEIIGGVEAKGRDEGTVVFVCKTSDGKEFRVRPKGTMEQRTEWMDMIDQLVGKSLTVRFQELSEDNVPIFPVGLVIRDYE